MDRIVALLLIVLMISQAQAQHVIGEKVPSAEKERYIVYPRSKDNSALYDTVDPYSFCNLLQTAIYSTLRTHRMELRGIDLRHRHHYRHCDPDLRFAFGPMSTHPIVNEKGGDSVLVLADGTTEYIYPPRDSLFFISRHFDDFVLREQERFDSLTGKKVYVPVEILLRKKSCVTGEPVVCLSINYDMLYEVPHDLLVTVPSSTGSPLLGKFETYLERGEMEFGPRGMYQPQGRFPRFTEAGNRALFLRGETYWQLHAPVSAILKQNEAGELGSFVVRDTVIAVNDYGEDSVFVDPITGENRLVYQINEDTVYFVKKGFETMVEHHILRYNRQSNSWSDYFNALWLTKTLVPGEVPYVVYSFPTEPIDVQNRNVSHTRQMKSYYAQHNNPFNSYVARNPWQIFQRFSWEDKLLRHQMKYTVISYDELFQ